MREPAEISFELARPAREDAAVVLAWRNDPATLQASFHREPKRPDTFEDEFRREYFRRPDLPPVFALANGVRAAFLRFQPAAPLARLRRCCTISVNVAPSHRGRGIGTAVLAAALPFLRGLGWDDVLAEIRVENAPSRRAFEAAGYALLDETRKTIDDTGEVAAIARYVGRATMPFGPAADRVLVIAEAGSNWRMGTPARDRRMAEELIDAAAEAGADAVKFQTYRPETVYVENAGGSDYLAAAGVREDIREIFADLAMPYELVPDLAARCRARGIAFMSTPFSVADLAAVDPHVAVHKCASYEISHVRLLEALARTGKPLILSTGASEEDDIAWAVGTFRAHGGRDLCLLQCTAKYPAPAEALNLLAIPWLARRFGVTVGLSDHSRHPTRAPVAAVALGARVIEKHFTLSNRLPGPDHAFAIVPEELREMVAAVRDAEAMLGTGVKGVLAEEQELREYARRGVQAIRPIAEGEPIREGVNVAILRPGKQRIGAHPRLLEAMEGRPSKRAIPLGDGVREGDWEP